jgi:hypothetical protein
LIYAARSVRSTTQGSGGNQNDMNLPAPLEPGRQTQLDEQKSLLYLNETEVPAIVIGDISGLVPSHREAVKVQY